MIMGLGKHAARPTPVDASVHNTIANEKADLSRIFGDIAAPPAFHNVMGSKAEDLGNFPFNRDNGFTLPPGNTDDPLA